MELGKAGAGEAARQQADVWAVSLVDYVMPPL